ncbi:MULTISPECIES: HNH endonuclease [Bacillus cereus group]|nr:HNH endonuclease signature motif containing protein [Bacillus cereus]MCR2013159.1 HNH endonuclease [Bacillus cereus]UQX84412.1 HNH endonuclease [Bacillus cereus]
MAAEVKRELREYLNSEFNGTCFYCQIKLRQGNAAFEIDHIVHKNKYRWFTYRADNLALSCRLCNTSKSVKETLIPLLQGEKFKYTNYPQISSSYKIIHAYYDKYEEHIELEDGIFYKAKNGSEKGKETIKICSLHRLKLAEDRAKELLLKAKEREREALGFRESFARVFESGTEEQMEQLIEKRIFELASEQEFFNRVIHITTNTTITNLGAKLEKTKGLAALDKKNLSRFKYLLKHTDLVKEHVNLLYLIENSKSIKRSIINYLLSRGVHDLDVNKPFVFNKETFDIIKLAFSQNDLKIDRRVRGRFSAGIELVNDLKTDFIRLHYFIKHASTFLKVCEVVDNISKNKTLVLLLGKLSEELISEIVNELSLLGDKAIHNSQLYSLTKLKMVDNIQKYDNDLMKEFYIVIKKTIKLLKNY